MGVWSDTRKHHSSTITSNNRKKWNPIYKWKATKKNWTQSWIRQGKKIGLTNAYIEIVKKSLVIARINGNN